MILREGGGAYSSLLNIDATKGAYTINNVPYSWTGTLTAASTYTITADPAGSTFNPPVATLQVQNWVKQ